MKLWLDAQFSPDIATWIAERFAIEAVPVRDVGLRDAADVEIFTAAKQARTVINVGPCGVPGSFSQLFDSFNLLRSPSFA